MLVTGSLAGDIGLVAAGFFAVMWLVSLRRRKPVERRYYTTEIPSMLHIEHEA